MVRKNIFLAVLFVSVTFLASSYVACFAQPADNTGTNKRDRSQEELTAEKQGQSKQDLEITQKIRRAITSDKSMSTYARNVKIITTEGKVTLKGPVRSEDEKKSVEEKAAQIAGNENVKSEIDIAPKKKGK
ncbi:MAG TPA: BON domain-containing protein [Syntrophorhabdaceae bacterium]